MIPRPRRLSRRCTRQTRIHGERRPAVAQTPQLKPCTDFAARADPQSSADYLRCDPRTLPSSRLHAEIARIFLLGVLFRVRQQPEVGQSAHHVYSARELRRGRNPQGKFKSGGLCRDAHVAVPSFRFHETLRSTAVAGLFKSAHDPSIFAITKYPSVSCKHSKCPVSYKQAICRLTFRQGVACR